MSEGGGRVLPPPSGKKGSQRDPAYPIDLNGLALVPLSPSLACEDSVTISLRWHSRGLKGIHQLCSAKTEEVMGKPVPLGDPLEILRCAAQDSLLTSHLECNFGSRLCEVIFDFSHPHLPKKGVDQSQTNLPATLSIYDV